MILQIVKELEAKNHSLYIDKRHNSVINEASRAIQSPCTVAFFLLISLLDGYSFANVHVKGIVAF